MLALPSFRTALLHSQISDPSVTFRAQGSYGAVAAPFSNIHATGVGIRHRDGAYISDDYVLKVYVFDPVAPDVLQQFQGLSIDIEPLPIQTIQQRRAQPTRPTAGRGTAATTSAEQVADIAIPTLTDVPPDIAPHRERQRPIPGGVSISPLGVDYVGTLGCFVVRRGTGREEVFALSNNHVLANTDRLPIGTPIVQPGPEDPPFLPREEDIFAVLRETIPIRFPQGAAVEPVNNFDAALAGVTNLDLIQPGALLGIPQYDPSSVVAPVPGMRVSKSGRTTGVTEGVITAIDVDGVQINYGSSTAPRIAIFDNTIEIAGDDGAPFSAPGDSGSVIVESESGHPVALLFAGDGTQTTACNLGALCRRLNIWPV